MSPRPPPSDIGGLPKVKIQEPPQPPHLSRLASSSSQPSPFRTQSRNTVQAGDLHTSTSNEAYRPLSRTFSALNTSHVARSSLGEGARRAANISGDDFDLREEVMSCIAKSIGLLQPPLSGTDSIETSPAFLPTDGRRNSSTGSLGSYNSSFSSLSLLDLGDDISSVTGGSSVASSGAYMSGLDNEVEMLFFAAGTTLAKAGELNTGEYTYHAHVRSFSLVIRSILCY